MELLSPINKVPTARTGAVPPAQAEFLQTRRATMASTTHWLEIDLLRAGERPPEVRSADPSPYYAARKRAGAADIEVWPIGLRDPLPAIGVPLPSPRQEVALDLQEAVDLVFARYRYTELLDYRSPPPSPAFALDDALWLAGRAECGQSAHAGKGIGDGPPDL